MGPLAGKALDLDALPVHKSNQVGSRHAKVVSRFLSCEPFLVRINDYAQTACETVNDPLKPLPGAVWQGERLASIEQDGNSRGITQTQAQPLEGRELGLGRGHWWLVH